MFSQSEAAIITIDQSQITRGEWDPDPGRERGLRASELDQQRLYPQWPFWRLCRGEENYHPPCLLSGCRSSFFVNRWLLVLGCCGCLWTNLNLEIGHVFRLFMFDQKLKILNNSPLIVYLFIDDVYLYKIFTCSLASSSNSSFSLRMIFLLGTRPWEETEQGCWKKPKKSVVTMTPTTAASAPGCRPSQTRRFPESGQPAGTLSSKFTWEIILPWKHNDRIFKPPKNKDTRLFTFWQCFQPSEDVISAEAWGRSDPAAWTQPQSLLVAIQALPGQRYWWWVFYWVFHVSMSLSRIQYPHLAPSPASQW